MAVVAGMLAGCGRIGFGLFGDDVAPDASPDGPRTLTPPTSQADCPPSYAFMGTSCYLYDDSVEMTWLAAESACETSDAHLVVVGDLAEAAIVDSLVPGNVLSHWYGASDLVTTGVFLTVTNEPLVPVFAAGHPMAGLDCAELLDSRELSTFDCADIDTFICEYDGVRADPEAF